MPLIRLNQRIMLNTGNGTIQRIDPLQSTQTHFNIEVIAKQADRSAG